MGHNRFLVMTLLKEVWCIESLCLHFFLLTFLNTRYLHNMSNTICHNWLWLHFCPCMLCIISKKILSISKYCFWDQCFVPYCLLTDRLCIPATAIFPISLIMCIGPIHQPSVLINDRYGLICLPSLSYLCEHNTRIDSPWSETIILETPLSTVI